MAASPNDVAMVALAGAAGEETSGSGTATSQPLPSESLRSNLQGAGVTELDPTQT